MATSNIIAFGTNHNLNHKSAANMNNRKVITTCRAILEQKLPDCFHFFTQLDDSLFKHAEQSENNQLQEEYFVAMRRFRVEQNKIKTQFTKAVLADYDALWSPAKSDKAAADTAKNRELSILQDELLEEKIALDNIVSKAEKHCQKEQHLFERRLAKLLDMDRLPRSPLDFRHIAQHLEAAVSPSVQGLDITIKLLVYKQFEQYAVPEFNTIFQQLNKALIDYADPAETAPPQHRQSQSASSAGSDTARQEEQEEDPALFEELRRLLKRNPAPAATTASPAAQTSSSSDVITLNALVSALSNLQHQQSAVQPRLDPQGELVIPDLRQTLHATLGQEKTVSQIDEDTINVISLLFEFILEDRAIPAPIRALLARLQLPMLKVAITDKTFFSKKHHTARRLLNNLAKVATGWDHSNGTDDILYNQIESIVNTILNQFDSDLTLFDMLNDQLDQFMAQQEQHSTLAEQRIAQATEGQEKLQLAEQEVDLLIHNLMADYSPVPKAVVALIEEGLKKVLRLRYLQKGKDSPEWQEAVTLLEQLLWSVSPKPTSEERKKLIDTIPELLRSLRAMLTGASFNQRKMTTLFNDLKACHIQCLNGDHLNEQQLQSVEKKTPESVPEQALLADVPAEKKRLPDDKAMAMAKSLQVGTWLEKKNDNGQVQRIKFSWRSNLTGRCLFVTYQGMKAADVSLPELASWFQQGLVEVLDADKPLVERALVSLKESMAAETTA